MSCRHLIGRPVVALILLGCTPAVPSLIGVSPQVLAPVLSQPKPGEAVYDAAVNIDLETAKIGASWTLRYIADETTADSIAFLLNHGLQLERLQGTGVRSFRSAPFEHNASWNIVVVDLDATVAPGSVVEFELVYSGQLDLPSDGINSVSHTWVELNGDSGWHPIFSTFDQEMVGHLRVVLPEEWDVIASGSASFIEGAHVIRNTVPQLDVAFFAAQTVSRVSAESFDLHVRSGSHDAAAVLLEAAERCAGYLNSRYGSQEPLPRGKLVLANRAGPGYARKNYIVLSQVDPSDEAGLHQFLCHELAHFWTPTAGAFSPHHWMPESFAEYVAARFLRDHVGQAEFDRRVDEFEQMGRAHGPVWVPESSQRPSFFIMYRRGPYLLSRLEEKIGTETFERFLQRYMVEHVTTTPELLEHLNAVAGAETEQWFMEELGRGPL